MNAQRNRSKAGGRKVSFRGGDVGDPVARRKAKADRLAATKKNSKKKRIRAKYATPKETQELVAKKVAQAQEAARKVFERRLTSPAVVAFAAKQRFYRLLRGRVEDALADALPLGEN